MKVTVGLGIQIQDTKFGQKVMTQQGDTPRLQCRIAARDWGFD